MAEVEVESGEPVWDLVAEFLERREQGEVLDPEEFVRAHPEVADRLRECLAGFQWMEETAHPRGDAVEEPLPRSFGNYELQRVIGRGGMGCVYEATHRPLGRRVAVKVLPQHLTHVREFRLRFLREARVVASLHHTHIAPVFEVGQIGNTLYLAMPYIVGPDLRRLLFPSDNDRVARARPSLRRIPRPFTRAYYRWVADIGVQAAEALAHAHSRGVVHRDVKPSNLLLDERGAVWMVDFGLAKAPTHPVVTIPGELIGTLRYASPEQVRGDPFDERTDIYSLGVTMYELLTRRPAFPPGAGTQIISSEPARPRQISPRIPRDLETIILRAMAKRPQDRYASAAALGDDLRRFLRDEPIRARPIGLVGRLVRWCRRNPALSLVSGAALLLIGSLAWFDHTRLISERDAEARARRIAAERFAELLTRMAEKTIESGRPGRTREAFDLLNEAAQIRFRSDLWELGMRALDQADAVPLAQLAGPRDGISALALSQDGRELVGAGPTGNLEIWTTRGTGRRSLPGFGEPLTALAWAAPRKTLIGVSSTRVWIGKEDRASQDLSDTAVLRVGPAVIALSPDAGLVAMADTALSVWDAARGEFIWTKPAAEDTDAAPYHVLGWSPDGSILAAVHRDQPQVDLWSMPRGEALPSIRIDGVAASSLANEPPISAVVIAPDNERIACGCTDGTVRLVRRLSGQTEHTLRGHEGPVRWLTYSLPTGWLLSADGHELRGWDPARGEPLGVLARIPEGIRACALDGSGEILVTADRSGSVRTWGLAGIALHQVIGPEPNRITALATSPDNRWIAWADAQGKLSIAELSRAQTRVECDSGLRDLQLCFSPGAKLLATGGQGDPPIRLRAVPDGPSKPLARGAPTVTALAFVGLGERLAAAHGDGKMIVWNMQSGEPFATVATGLISALASSADGKWLAAGGRNGSLQLWNTASMSQVHLPAAHTAPVTGIQFTPDSQTLVSAGGDGRISTWRVPSLSRQLSLEGPGGPIVGLRVCLDGTTLASCSGDNRVILWSLARMDRVGVFTARFAGRFDALAVTADGTQLIAAGGPRPLAAAAGPGAIELWDLAETHRALVDAGLPDWRAENPTPQGASLRSP